MRRKEITNASLGYLFSPPCRLGTKGQVNSITKFNAVDLGCWLHEGKSDATSLVGDFLSKLFDKIQFDTSTKIFAVTSDTTGKTAEKAGKMIWIAGVMKQEQEAFGTIESSLVDLCND